MSYLCDGSHVDAGSLDDFLKERRVNGYLREKYVARFERECGEGKVSRRAFLDWASHVQYKQSPGISNNDGRDIWEIIQEA